ncbi:MAG: YihY/virulence factor BrkB family protein [Planctomycetota bacterium]|jgi:membrane protein
MVTRVVNFLKTDIWRLRLKNLPRRKSFLIRQLRIIVLAVRGFDEDKCRFRASALTFYSLLSTVPVIAMMFGIAKGFGLAERVEAEILAKVQTEEQILVAKKIIKFANSLLEETSGGFIAGIGVAFLFWAIIKLLSNIENSFNNIWGVKIPRSFGRKFSDYLSVMLVCPILLVMAGSATVVISSQIREFIANSPFFSFMGPVVFFLLRLLPYCTLWIAFSFIFIFIPNTKVKFSSGLLGGIVAGTIFQIVQWIYIKFQVGTANYNTIYGSFAALPLFLLWLQISWIVILFGAEVSFANQNVETYEFEPDCLNVSRSFKKLLALLVAHLLIKNFGQGKPPSNAEQIAHALEIPIRLAREVLYELLQANIISECKNGNDKIIAYQPARDPEDVTIEFVLNALDHSGTADIPIAETEAFTRIRDSVKTFADTVQGSPANIPLKNI